VYTTLNPHCYRWKGITSINFVQSANVYFEFTLNKAGRAVYFIYSDKKNSLTTLMLERLNSETAVAVPSVPMTPLSSCRRYREVGLDRSVILE